MSGRHPSREDRALWRRTMRDVKPLAPGRLARAPAEPEPEAGKGLRIRILASDGAWEPADVSVTADSEAAVKTVSDWLAARLHEERRETGSDHPM